MFYTTLTIFSISWCAWSDVDYLYHDCPPVRKIIHSLKLVDYLHVQVDNPWYKFYLSWTSYQDIMFQSNREQFWRL